MVARYFLILVLAVALPKMASAVPGRSAGADNTAADSLTGDSEEFEQTLLEGQELLLSRRPIDARAELQRALQLNPNDYRPHMFLAQYYLFDVAHFKLAYRYILKAQELFEKKWGDGLGGVVSTFAKQHANILYLRAETELNLDRYADSLATLDRFGSLYWTDWYPGTRAWVLMKLKRIDEAIKVAQAGLLRGADPRRTYNILGILQSVKGYREQSLEAFRQSIRAELLFGSGSQVATPLNNAGEVYRELFQDELAEASWLRATNMPDGCDHILPSLNLTILYIDEVRLFQAERTLQDFEACFAAQSERQDSEHRALLAMARGRIALRSGDVEKAIKDINTAIGREQWFGKIGTNENDVRLAATISMGEVLKAKAATLRDTARDNFRDRIWDRAQIPALKLRAWWQYRQAREQGIVELDDWEDLSIRNTDTMIEYPTLGKTLSGFPERSLAKRLERMIAEDTRPNAKIFYRLYLAGNLMTQGEYLEAKKIFQEILPQLRARDRLARAETLVGLIQAERKVRYFWQRPDEDERKIDFMRREELFSLIPSYVRFNDLKLPVNVQLAESEAAANEIKKINKLLSRRFEAIEARVNFQLQIGDQGEKDGGREIELKLVDRNSNAIRARNIGVITSDGKGYEELVNKFITSAFSHKLDPPSEPVPKLSLLEGIM